MCVKVIASQTWDIFETQCTYVNCAKKFLYFFFCHCCTFCQHFCQLQPYMQNLKLKPAELSHIIKAKCVIFALQNTFRHISLPFGVK